jgi:Flp pilus assembly protein TadG
MMRTGKPHAAYREFLSDRGGNIAILFAFSVVVIFISVGLAVDFSRFMGAKTRTRNALDVAALATARALSVGEVPNSGNQAENYFKAMFASNVGADNFSASGYRLNSFTINTATNTVSATASYEVPLTFLRFATSKTKQTVGSRSAVKYGIGSIEVAMVLDVTGSMGGSRIAALKSAAKLGIEELLKANTGGKEYIRISLVPYSDSINAGVLARYVYPDYKEAKSDAPVYNAGLFAGTGVGYDVEAFQNPYRTDCRRSGYTFGRPYGNVRYMGDLQPARVMQAAYGGGYDRDGYNDRYDDDDHKRKRKRRICRLPSDFIVEKNGASVDDCATDRKAPKSRGRSYQYTDANPLSGMISRDSRLRKNGCTSSKIIPLTGNIRPLRKAISTLRTRGWTAGHIGLQWAWYTISHKWAKFLPSGSMPGDMGKKKDLRKYIILMTDGEFNTAYAGTSSSKVGGKKVALSKQHTAALCTAIKAAGIKIFTVGFQTPRSADVMLHGCASPKEGTVKYSYEPNNAKDLKATFKHIAGLVGKLRLAR